MNPFFMFATGIEASAPMIDNGRTRMDQMARSAHHDLRQDNGRLTPVGLFDLERNIRPAGEASRKLIADWQYVLPARSVCLIAPVVMRSEYDESFAKRRHGGMRHYHRQHEVLVGSAPSQ